jgi:hypothetical protein
MRTASLVALAVVLAAGLATAGDDDPELEPMWILPGALQHSVGSDCSGRPDTGSRGGLPAGLRVMGKPLSVCGQWIRIHVPKANGGYERLITGIDMVARKPPKKDVWKAREPMKEGWVRGTSTWGIPLDQPDWETPVPLREGEHVQLLEENDRWIVRTLSGRVLVVRFGAIEYDRDPVLKGSRASDRKDARERWEAGRKLRETGPQIAGILPSARMVEGRNELTGRLFTLEFSHDDLSDEVFESGWVGPVQQVLRNECRPGRNDVDEPCGTYLLDYRAIGAWWPTRRGHLLVEFTGTDKVGGTRVPRLRVLVVDPWKSSGGVGPAWAEGSG